MHARVQRDRHDAAVARGRRAEVRDLRRGELAVRQHRGVALRRAQVRGAPVHLGDLAQDPGIDLDPVADAEGALQVERDAREQVRERALQRQAHDHAEDARGRDQAGDRLLEHRGDHAQRDEGRDDGAHDVDQQLGHLHAVAREDRPDEALDHHEGKQPRRDPPQEARRARRDGGVGEDRRRELERREPREHEPRRGEQDHEDQHGEQAADLRLGAGAAPREQRGHRDRQGGDAEEG
jgi:hypothetical protein